ncbi:MAG: hypothetical protein IPK82_22820 [Polyangiaceae bacterium]|nr:hypothetical protein [Polyangiaceae bacterium]
MRTSYRILCGLVPATLVVSSCFGEFENPYIPEDGTQSCYEGPPGTANVGTCRYGELELNGEGKTVSACLDQVLPEPECTLSGVDTSCDGKSGALIWQRQMDGPSLHRMNDMAVFPDGSVIVTGYTWGDAVIAGQKVGAGAFVVKLTAEGEGAWAKTFGPGGAVVGTSVRVDAENNVVVGVGSKAPLDLGGGTLNVTPEVLSDLIVKLDGDTGAHLWSLLIENHTDDYSPSPPIPLANGDIAVLGLYSGDLRWDGENALSNDSEPHLFLSILDGDGHHQKSFDYGPGIGPDAAEVSPDGALVFLGHTGLALPTLGATLLESETFFVAKLGVDGAVEWARSTGRLGNKNSHYFGRSIALQPDGKVAVAIPFVDELATALAPNDFDQLDVAILAFSGTGEFQWAKSFGGDGMDAPWDIAAAEDGGWVVGGTYEGTLGLGTCTNVAAAKFDGFLTKLDAQGEPLWVHTFGDDGADDGGPDPGWPSEIVMAVQVAPSGEVVMAAKYDGSVNFGGELQPFAAAEATAVVKYSP